MPALTGALPGGRFFIIQSEVFFLTTVHTLASGSSGNAALLSCDGASFLIDAGISCRRITAALRELGELLYATHTGTPTDSEALLAKMEEICLLKARVRELEGDPVVHLLCPRCGREVRPDDVYCRDCGEKL